MRRYGLARPVRCETLLPRATDVRADRDDDEVLNNAVPAGTIDLSELGKRWELLDQLYGHVDRVLGNRNEQVLCARAIDEGQVAGHRVYMSAHRHLGVARDNHDALIALIRGDHGLTLFAPWNLLRATFEAAFYAAWVLDPNDSLERRRRGLRLEYLDERDHAQYYADVMTMAAGHPEDADDFDGLKESLASAALSHSDSYSREARELGLQFPEMPGVKVLKELGALSFTRAVEDWDVLLRSVWHGVSGLAHGRSSALMRATDKADGRPTKGGMHVILSVNDDVFINAAMVSTQLHMEAVRLLIVRRSPNS